MAAVLMAQTSVSGPVLWAGCELVAACPPVECEGWTYYCSGCAAGGPCHCSYDYLPDD